MAGTSGDALHCTGIAISLADNFRAAEIVWRNAPGMAYAAYMRKSSSRRAIPAGRARGRRMKDALKKLERIAALLREETTLSLATTGQDGEVSVAPLFYIADGDLSLYWLSSEDSLHSQNLKSQPRVAATVYRNAMSWREIRGIQTRGSVGKVTDSELRRLLIAAYCERFKLGRILQLAARQSALYCFKPEFFRYIDNARGFGCKFELTRQPAGWSLTRP